MKKVDCILRFFQTWTDKLSLTERKGHRLSRLCQNVGGVGLESLLQFILPEFALKGPDRDSQAICRMGSVAAVLVKCLDDRAAFELFHRDATRDFMTDAGRLGTEQKPLWEITLCNGVRFRKDDHAFERIAQLSDVAGPSIRLESANNLRRYFLHLSVLVLGDFAKEMFDQNRDVIRSVS